MKQYYVTIEKHGWNSPLTMYAEISFDDNEDVTLEAVKSKTFSKIEKEMSGVPSFKFGLMDKVIAWSRIEKHSI